MNLTDTYDPPHNLMHYSLVTLRMCISVCNCLAKLEGVDTIKLGLSLTRQYSSGVRSSRAVQLTMMLVNHTFGNATGASTGDIWTGRLR